MTALPQGWTMDRVRSLVADAELISADRVVTTETLHGRRALEAALIIHFSSEREGGYCLVQCVGGDEWYMGWLMPDGAVNCWATYGTDLELAIRAL